MKRNVNVFIGVVLCAVLGGCFWWLASADEGDQWSPNEIYSEVHRTSAGGFSHTHASSVSSNNGGVALTLSSPSATFRRRTSSIYAGAYSGAATMPLTSNLSPLTYGAAPGAGLHLTSSAEIKSFGGGGNGGAAMGGALSKGRSNSGSFSPSLQGGVGVGSISPIAYSTARRGEMSSAAGDDLAMMAAENPVASVASATVGMSNGYYGGYSAMDYSSSAGYGGYTSSFGANGRSNVRGRQNAGVSDSWLDWLYRHADEFVTGTGSDETGWTYTFTEQQLRDAYNEYITNYWDPMWSPNGENGKPTFEQWLAWFQNGGESGYNYNNNWYMMAPVGDVLPLLLMTLLYVLFIAIRSKLLKVERSE